MKKNIFYNNAVIYKNLDTKDIFSLKKIDKKKIVDINKLLNRVKMDKKFEKKEKFIFFGLGIFLLGFMGIFVSIIS